MASNPTPASASAPAPAPNQAQAPAPQTLHGTAAIDSLQAMVNLVLTTTGRYLQQAKNGGQSTRNQFSMKRAIPAALERFHNSLDDLEEELHNAKTTIRRDRALLIEDREKREQAEAEERERLAAETSAKKDITQKDTAGGKQDVPGKDSGQAPAPEQNKDEALEESKGEDEAPSQDKPEANKEPPKPDPIDTTTTEQERDPLFDETPLESNPQDTEFDFDAMFANVESNEPQGDSNQGNEESNAPELNFTLDDNDGGSLLRGLEDFANSANDATTNHPAANNDFDMLDIAMDLSTSGHQAGQQGQGNDGGADAQNQTSQAQPTDDMLDQMQTDANLDELFNIDDYANPEGTQFDDAFFGFDES